MRNGAHASDSEENALRERGIVHLRDRETASCDISQIIGEYLEQCR